MTLRPEETLPAKLAGETVRRTFAVDGDGDGWRCLHCATVTAPSREAFGEHECTAEPADLNQVLQPAAPEPAQRTTTRKPRGGGTDAGSSTSETES